jgi:hypothetical protein
MPYGTSLKGRRQIGLVLSFVFSREVPPGG